MYQHILVPLENSRYDTTILAHVRKLAKMTGARLTLIHVANGFAARLFDNLNLRESEEMKGDQDYLNETVKQLSSEGFQVNSILARGEPSDEILRVTKEQKCDLIAMATHGHRFLSDLFYGSTARSVRHHAEVPVLLLKGPQ